MTYLKLLLTAFFWGGTFIAGRIIASNVDPFAASFLRFAIASFFLVIITLKIEGKIPKINIRQFILTIMLGLTGVFSYNIFFFKGLGHIEAGRASLIIALNPIFISLASSIVFKERLTLVKVIGLLLSVSGALVVISNGNLNKILNFNFGTGELLILGCVLSWGAYSIIGRGIMDSLSPLASVTYSSVIGTLFLFLPAVRTGMFQNIALYSLPDWLSLFYLGFFGTVLGFLWYYQGINKIGPTKASVFINFVPVSAIILSFLILKEPITLSLLFGGALVITGVYFTNSSKNFLKIFKNNI